MKHIFEIWWKRDRKFSAVRYSNKKQASIKPYFLIITEYIWHGYHMQNGMIAGKLNDSNLIMSR